MYLTVRNQLDKSGEVDDKPDPQTEYGRTKRMGEELVEKHVSNFYIIRTAWVLEIMAKTSSSQCKILRKHIRP